jgi:hypothetical protein
MRDVADAARIQHFMRALGAEADVPARVYFTGGATAVLLGWRASTIDVDIKMVPETDRLFRAIPQIKESLHLNVELASPADFVPVRAGWEERSPYITQDGRVAFHHFELCAQALGENRTQPSSRRGGPARDDRTRPCDSSRRLGILRVDRIGALSLSGTRPQVVQEGARGNLWSETRFSGLTPDP